MEIQFCHLLQHLAGSLDVCSFIRGEDEEVIHVDDEPSLGNHIPEGVVHESLECSRGVIKTKEHDCRFEKPLVGDESRLPLVSVLNVNIIVSPSNIKLGKVPGVFEFVDKVRDEGEGVCVTDGMLVQIVVILAGAEFPILLFDKEERGGLGGVGGTDFS